MATLSSRVSQEKPRPPKAGSRSNMEDIAKQLVLQVNEQLPGVLQQLLRRGFNPGNQPLQLECSLTAGTTSARETDSRVQVASVALGRDLTPLSSAGTPQDHSTTSTEGLARSPPHVENSESSSPSWNFRPIQAPNSRHESDNRPVKRRKETKGHRHEGSDSSIDIDSPRVAPTVENGTRTVQKKRTTDNPALQPSTLSKFISGVWDSIFSGVRMDPAEVIQQWQAIESSGQPRLLTETDGELAVQRDTGVFGRMNVLTRKISQTSKTCKSMEVIVQAHWIQCFDDRVAELSETMTREKAKKTAISEACVDFNWTQKELRNKMAIWRGYHDVKITAGWVALVFAGTGLYRFCKYRKDLTEEAFQTLRHLRHRFEVAADTLHPHWRVLLSLVGGSTEPKYSGHPHDWVVNGPGDEAIPLPQTYRQWDENFSYTHLDSSVVNQEIWGDFDPRTIIDGSDPAAYTCQKCNEQQSNDPTRNSCVCYQNLYGSPKAGMAPVQVAKTPDGKNNGLFACCPFEKGWAVGEFVGQITNGLQGLDVFVDQTERARYQIYQGRQGNHTRFVNHSCEPNSHYEHFAWLGKQRTVLVSKGIEAGEEVTVDYGITYWEGLDKECMCGKPGCRYRDRSLGSKQLLTHPDMVDESIYTSCSSAGIEG